MSGAARGHVPARLRALPRDQLGCVHLADTSKDKMDALLERYAAALRYGRRILEGDLRPHDATDAEEPRSKRTRLAYPTCSRCGMDLRRPYVCLTCAYTACFFRDPITDAAAAAGGSIRGFTSLMPTWEEGEPVVYCYEIHLKPEMRGFVFLNGYRLL